MTGLTLMFVVVFVLILAAVCALLVLRMLGSRELPEAARFPRHRTRYHHVSATGGQRGKNTMEEPAKDRTG
jgi:hypothetical protein